MTDPINLNRFRKDHKRTDDKVRADANAARFGRTKAERVLEAARTAQAGKKLDDHRIEDE